jgi:hypothetical protein
MHVEFDRNEKPKRRKIPPTPQARKVSHHSNISQYETERKARKLLYSTKPETGPLHSRTPKELPETVSADKKKSRYKYYHHRSHKRGQNNRETDM